MVDFSSLEWWLWLREELLRGDSSSSGHYWQGQGFGLVFLSLPLLDVGLCLVCSLLAMLRRERFAVHINGKKSVQPDSLQDYSVSSFGNPALFPSLTLIFPSEFIFSLVVASMFFWFLKWGVWQHPLGHVGAECVREGGAALSNIPGNLGQKKSKKWRTLSCAFNNPSPPILPRMPDDFLQIK